MEFRTNNLDTPSNDEMFSPLVSEMIWRINKKYPQWSIDSIDIPPDSFGGAAHKAGKYNYQAHKDGFQHWNEITGGDYLQDFVYDTVKKNAGFSLSFEIGGVFRYLIWLALIALIVFTVYSGRKIFKVTVNRDELNDRMSDAAKKAKTVQGLIKHGMEYAKDIGNSIRQKVKQNTTVSNAVFCKKCGAKNKKEALFCMNCGRKFERNTDESNSKTDVAYCRKCGAQNPAGAKFCAKCGEVIDETQEN